MDAELVRRAYCFQALIKGKHQLARSIDSATRQLIQHIISSSTTASEQSIAYVPTKEKFQADLQAFADTVFRSITKPLSQPPSLADITKAVDKIVATHTKSLEYTTARHLGVIGQKVDKVSADTDIADTNIRNLFENSDHKHNELMDCFHSMGY